MTQSGGSNINVGGVNFSIGIDLAAFEAALAKAEQLAKTRAKQIQQVLNPPKGAPGSLSGIEQVQDVVVRQKRRVIPPPPTVETPPAPPTINQTQDVVITRRRLVRQEGSGGATQPEHDYLAEIAQRDAEDAARSRTLLSRSSFTPASVNNSLSTQFAALTTNRPVGPDPTLQATANQIYDHLRGRNKSHDEAVAEAQRITNLTPTRKNPASTVLPSLNYFQNQESAKTLWALRRPIGADNGGGPGGPIGGSGRSGSSSNPFARELNTVGLIRIAGGFLGIQLGINVAAGAARDLHQAILKIIDSSIQLEQSGRQVGVAFGSSSRVFTGPGATAFAANPLTRGTTSEYQQLVAGFAPLAAQFKLSNGQIDQVATASGQLARIWGVELNQAGQVLQSVLRGNLDAGQALDLQLTNEYGIIRNVGLTWDQLVQAQGPAAARATVLAQVQADVDRQLKNNAANADDAVKAFDRLGKSWDELRNKLAKGASGPVGGAAGAAAGVIEHPEQSLLEIAKNAAIGLGVATLAGPLTPLVIQALIEKGVIDQRNKEIQANQIKLNPNNGPAGGFDPENPSAGFLAYQKSITDQAQGIVAGSEYAIPTKGQIDTQTATGAKEQQRLAGLRSSLAQSRLDVLSAEADRRKLSVQETSNQLLRDRIGLQDKVAPLLITEQRLQNDIAQTTRENFDLTKAQLQARQVALGPTRALSGYEYAQNEASAKIGVALAESVAGQTPEYDIGEQINVGLQNSPLFNVGRAKANLANVQAQRGVQLSGFDVEQDTLEKQVAAIPLRKQLQDITLNEINQVKLDMAVKDAQIAQLDRYLQAQSLAAPIQEKLIAAELQLTEARKANAEAAVALAQIAADTPAANGAGPGIGSVNVTINLNDFVAPTTGTFQDQLDRLAQAAMTGTLDALAKGARVTSPRVDTGVAGARDTTGLTP